MAELVKRNHWVVRLTHWVNAVAIVIMAGSGMRIFNAHPSFARPGEHFALNPWEGQAIPALLTFGSWLGGARHWHFAMMWVLVLNGLVYLGFLWLHGEWRDIVPRRGDAGNAIEMIKFYLFVRRDHPIGGKHNALQKSAYFAMPVLAAVIVLSGLAIWKPITLGFITALFVNYKWARFTHFAAMTILVLLAVVLAISFWLICICWRFLRALLRRVAQIFSGKPDPGTSPAFALKFPFSRKDDHV